MKLKNTLLLSSLLTAAIGIGLYLGNRGPDSSNSATTPLSARLSNSESLLSAATTQRADDAKLISARSLFDGDVTWRPAAQPSQSPGLATADLSVIATALLPKESFMTAGRPSVGSIIKFGVGEPTLHGKVEAVFPDDHGHFFASGLLPKGQRGEFVLSQDLKTRAWRGRILDYDHRLGYTFETKADKIVAQKRPLSALACAMPRSPDWKPLPADMSFVEATVVAPALDSKPTASAVVYLDFDGEVVTDPSWNGGMTVIAAPAMMGYPGVTITSAQIQDVWQRVVEDFRPFDISVTTIRSRYDNAHDGERARVIITSTEWSATSDGGDAKIKSYRSTSEGFSSTIPGWVFNRSSAQEMAVTISHELGHMLNLSHDGTITQGADSYYAGHDSGVRSWGPIMGAPFGKSLTQWSKGEYFDANNTEDDIAVIASTLAEAGVTTGLVADDIGDTSGTAKTLSVLPNISDGGVITSASDVDWFGFKSNGGGIVLTVSPQAVDANFDADVAILDSTGAPVPGMSKTPQNNVPAIKITGNLPVALGAQYYVAVRGNFQPQPGATGIAGYSTYGSLGIYTLTGTYSPAPELPVITKQPVDATLTQGSSVTLSVSAVSNSALTYQWFQKITGQPDKLLTGKTSATLSLSAIQPASAGVYYVRCHNATGDTFSRDTTVVVRYKPVITQQPLPAKQGPLAVGTTVSYQIIANGTAPITYQWKKNNVVMPGETADTLNLGAVDWFDAASYTCVITNPLGTVTSTAASFTVASPPVFTAPVAFVSPVVDPSYKYIPLGGTGSFSVTAVGTAPITYEWYQNGTKVASAVNKTSFSWSSIKPTAAGTYYVRAFNAVGSVTSPNFIVEVQDKPVIDTNPVATLSAQADQSVTISCAAHGTDTVATPLRYQWQLNSVNIVDGSGYSGATTNTLSVNPVHWRHKGTYRCVVTNAVGAATTKNCVFTVVSYPVILTQPVAAKKIAKGGSATLSVVAGGTGTLKYQWYQKVSGLPDKLLTGKTAASLTLSAANATTTNGSYYCIVTLLTPSPMPGTATSTDCVVTVEDPPAPGPVISSLGRLSVGLNEPVTLSVNALGSPTLRYQWQKGTVDIVGATNSSLIFTAPQFTDTASYRVKVTNDVGSVFSAAAALKVVNKPSIIQQPLNLSLFEYDNASFTVIPSGSAPFTYQWYYNGTAITANASAKTATLTINGIRIITTTGSSNAGSYHCVVTNGAGTVTSNDATLTITPVPAPTLSDARPTHIARGDTIMLTGTNLNWFTGAKIGTTSLTFVKNGATEVFVTLPAGATIAASGALTITTLGGTSTYPTAITLHTDGAENDNFLNAKILTFSGSNYVGRGNNTTAGIEVNEPLAYVNHTLWFRWRAPITGKMTIRSTGSTVENENDFYSGPRLPAGFNDLNFIGYFYDYFGYFINDPGYWDFNVVGGQDYYFRMDSGWSGRFGTLGLGLTVRASGQRSLFSSGFEAVQNYVEGPLAPQQGWQVSGGPAKIVEAEPGDHVGSIGGTANDSVVSAWHATGDDSKSNVDAINVTADVLVRSTIGTEESFTFGLFDADGSPAVALKFNSADGSIQVTPAIGNTHTITQTFVPGNRYPVVFAANKVEGTWSVHLNGIEIASGDGWQAPPGGLVSIGATWQPAAEVRTGGSIEFDNINVTALDAATEVTR